MKINKINTFNDGSIVIVMATDESIYCNSPEELLTFLKKQDKTCLKVVLPHILLNTAVFNRLMPQGNITHFTTAANIRPFIRIINYFTAARDMALLSEEPRENYNIVYGLIQHFFQRCLGEAKTPRRPVRIPEAFFKNTNTQEENARILQEKIDEITYEFSQDVLLLNELAAIFLGQRPDEANIAESSYLDDDIPQPPLDAAGEPSDRNLGCSR